MMLIIWEIILNVLQVSTQLIIMFTEFDFVFDTEHELEKNIFQGDSFLSENNTMGTDDIVSLDSNPFDF